MKLDFFFFLTKDLVIPCFKSQMRITGTRSLLHQDGCVTVAQGGDRGSSSCLCTAESEPEPRFTTMHWCSAGTGYSWATNLL